MGKRGSAFVKLPADQIAQAKRLRAGIHPMPWRKLAKHLAVTEHRLRRTIDETYRNGALKFPKRAPCSPNITPSQTELEAQRLRDYVHPDLTAELLGDPPPWRSALARKATQGN